MYPSLQEAPERTVAGARRRRVARVLLAETDLASRLALNSILAAAGYAVDAAATAAEAIGKLDEREYQLVLADLRSESEEAGPRVLAYARQKDFRPATALVFANMSETGDSIPGKNSDERIVGVSDENVSYLLDRVADLISHRAKRRIREAVQRAH